MKFVTYLLPFIVVAVVAQWMSKTKRNVETNDIINRFKELTINACYSRCKNQLKCSVFAMNEDILMGETAECVLLRNPGNQNYVELKEELFVYEKVSVKDHYSNICLDVSFKLCPLNTCHYIVLNWHVISPDGDYTFYLYIQWILHILNTHQGNT